MASFGGLNWTIVIAYLIGNLFLGYVMSRRVKTSEDYYLGDRSAPWWAIGISVVATYVSALSFLGGPAWAYGDGMAALAIHINYPLVIFIVAAFFLPFFYNSGVASIYEYLERRFGKASRRVMSILFLITQTISTGAILAATVIVVDFVTGIGTMNSILVISTIVLIYTLMGGMNAVIWTDVLQGIILFIGAGVVLYSLLTEGAPMAERLAFLKENGKLDPLNFSPDITIAPTVWAGIIAMTLFHITVYGSNQMMVQRVLAAKNIGDAKKSYLLMGYGAFFIYFLFFFIGALLFAHYQAQDFPSQDMNKIILFYAQKLAFPGLMGIIVAAVMSASMSTMSSALNSLSTISVVDFYKPLIKKDAPEAHYLLASRIMTFFWAVMVIPVAYLVINEGGSVLEVLSKIGSYLVGAKLAMFGMGFFSKNTTERGLLIGVVAGFIALVLLAPFGPLTAPVSKIWAAFGVVLPTIAWPWFVVIGGGVNILVSWLASLILDGRQSKWHEQSVPGQIQSFKDKNLPEKDGGWYVVPGKIDAPFWGLLVLFALIMIFLAWFGTLGG
jgi:SSS family solute:Na+ symporter